MDAIDYVCAGTVTFGCALFVLTGDIAAPQQLHLKQEVAAVAASAAAVRGSHTGPVCGGAASRHGRLH